jgi:hypothetical protein
MIHNYRSKKKLWVFTTVKVDSCEIEVREEIFNLNLEINQLRLMIEDAEEYKKRIRLVRKLANKIEELKKLREKIKNNT